MNHWTKLSIEYANQRSYLDDLFRVYPTIPDGIRDIDGKKWDRVEEAYCKKDNVALVERLLDLDLFPIKDSYVAFLKRDRSSLKRNPKTVKRICGRLYEMGINEIYQKCSEPKETNRQIGPLFRDWLNKKTLGIDLVSLDEFSSSNEDAVLYGSDQELATFAKNNLNYTREKGLDFVARVNKNYVIGESKFLTDFGGHQNAQFEDAIQTLTTPGVKARKIAILDGVLYLKSKNKMHLAITGKYRDCDIMSALVLREFLHQL